MKKIIGKIFSVFSLKKTDEDPRTKRFRESTERFAKKFGPAMKKLSQE